MNGPKFPGQVNSGWRHGAHATMMIQTAMPIAGTFPTNCLK
jgi:hypothetical protein